MKISKQKLIQALEKEKYTRHKWRLYFKEIQETEEESYITRSELMTGKICMVCGVKED